MSERDSINREIKEIELSTANHTILRAAGTWALHGERPSKYFLNLEKIRSKNRMIMELINDQGEVINDQRKKLEEEKAFFQPLYCREGAEEELTSLDQLNLDREVVPRISRLDHDRLEEPYSIDELSSALA